jgi:putative ABC transport system permease protein
MAIIVVAAGVGANTAAFSLADFVFLRPLPFRDPDKLVRLWENHPGGYSRTELSPANYRDWKRMNTVFEDIAISTSRPVNMVGVGDPVRLDASAVSANLLSVLGTSPFMGRSFVSTEGQPGSPLIVLLSYSLWRDRFGGDPHVIGRLLVLNDKPYTVIGVMPSDFYFPRRESQMWFPLQFDESDYDDRSDNYLEAVGRLRAGVTLEAARAEMDVVTSRLQAQYPKENKDKSAYMYFMREDLSRRSRVLLFALCGASISLLLITCASLANLMLARALQRSRELAIRAALGAGKERLVRQLFTESALIAAVGAALGIAIGAAALPLLSQMVPNSLPIAQTPSLDLRLLAIAIIVAGATTVGFGMLPALRVSSKVDFAGLREGTSATGGRKQRLRSMLVVAEVLVTVVLLVCSGLLLRALWKLRSTDPGFQKEHVLTLRTSLSFPKYEKTATRVAFYSQVLEKVRALPGVTSAAYICLLPMAEPGMLQDVHIPGLAEDKDNPTNASMRFVTPGFFQTLGIPLMGGRDIADSDVITAPHVAIVSRSFVRRYFPNEDPIGKHFGFALHDRAIVGVVGDIKVRGLEQESEPQVYISYQQVEDGSLIGHTPKNLVVRSSADPSSLLPSIRKIVYSVDSTQPIANVRTLSEIVEHETESRSVQVRVLAAFAAISFLLAGLGIHGLLSLAVSQRTQEIGIRLALGAPPSHIVSMITSNAARLALAGIIPGLFLAYVAGRMLESILAGVKPADAPTFVAAAVLCAVMTFAGCIVPTLRALRVDPMTAIRAE